MPVACGPRAYDQPMKGPHPARHAREPLGVLGHPPGRPTRSQIMVVAEKFLTGFNQPKLCVMYVDKTLTGPRWQHGVGWCLPGQSVGG